MCQLMLNVHHWSNVGKKFGLLSGRVAILDRALALPPNRPTNGSYDDNKSSDIDGVLTYFRAFNMKRSPLLASSLMLKATIL